MLFSLGDQAQLGLRRFVKLDFLVFGWRIGRNDSFFANLDLHDLFAVMRRCLFSQTFLESGFFWPDKVNLVFALSSVM